MATRAVLIVGRGKLAVELLQGVEDPSIARVLRWDERSAIQEPCHVVHAGSGRELDAVLAFCAETRSTLFELSTGDVELPERPGFPIVLCPNVNLQMLRFMAMIKRSARLFAGQDIRILESHQASKTTKPGTALYLAKSLGVPDASVGSVRDSAMQKETLGIPEAFLDRHAYHRIAIDEGDVEIRLQTRVLGKTAYASGLSKIIGIVAGRRLEPGFHDVVDLVLEDAEGRL